MDTRCTCRIVKAPTYEVYVQEPCGIHRAMVEKEREKVTALELQIDELKQELRDEKMAYHMVCGERDSAREAYKRSEDKATALAKELERSNRGPR